MYHINPRPILAQVPKARGLVLDSQIDMGCKTNFAIYYFLIILRRIYRNYYLLSTCNERFTENCYCIVKYHGAQCLRK